MADATLIGMLNIIDELKGALQQAQQMLQDAAKEKETLEAKVKELEKKKE